VESKVSTKGWLGKQLPRRREGRTLYGTDALIGAVIAGVVFPGCRELALWYWKVDEVVSKLDAIHGDLAHMARRIQHGTAGRMSRMDRLAARDQGRGKQRMRPNRARRASSRSSGDGNRRIAVQPGGGRQRRSSHRARPFHYWQGCVLFSMCGGREDGSERPDGRSAPPGVPRVVGVSTLNGNRPRQATDFPSEGGEPPPAWAKEQPRTLLHPGMAERQFRRLVWSGGEFSKPPCAAPPSFFLNAHPSSPTPCRLPA
jgi:hypothetical protein